MSDRAAHTIQLLTDGMILCELQFTIDGDFIAKYVDIIAKRRVFIFEFCSG